MDLSNLSPNKGSVKSKTHPLILVNNPQIQITTEPPSLGCFFCSGYPHKDNNLNKEQSTYDVRNFPLVPFVWKPKITHQNSLIHHLHTEV